jgi:hypothetical protein
LVPVWLKFSEFEPNDASKDCKPARKLIAVETIGDNRLRVAGLVSPVSCAAPRTLSGPGIGLPPASTSIPAAIAMQTDEAEDVPKGVGKGLELCQE